MLIENYFAKIRNILSKLPIIQRFEIETDGQSYAVAVANAEIIIQEWLANWEI
ncbi:hypothetical protein H6F42_13390 [Pseudanabaena sp. FACHB-1998]|uniref:hypothetical protein n=1 Tax=Pseudanabaena sp. FACHB-1998 TaxID=2692858 RepID=UPI0016809739|nr:hypothetical protein [Pseudanabaena sp. FACHB-1998]MBD2177908.1 hypothetical protein [Pseudanabaena sp. FACHB-1998]